MPKSTRHIEVLLGGPVEAADGAQVKLLFTISAVEQFFPAAATDADTVVIALTVSSVQVFGAIDTAIESFKLIPSGTDIGPVFGYNDFGTISLKFEFGVDDCHAIATPHWHLEISKRWTVTLVTNRWHVVAVGDRWHSWSIGIAVDNPCLLGV